MGIYIVLLFYGFVVLWFYCCMVFRFTKKHDNHEAIQQSNNETIKQFIATIINPNFCIC